MKVRLGASDDGLELGAGRELDATKVAVVTEEAGAELLDEAVAELIDDDEAELVDEAEAELVAEGEEVEVVKVDWEEADS